MTVKIILLRRVPPEKHNDLLPLLVKLRSLCMNRRGYISGETLVNVDDPTENLVISTWATAEAWNDWMASADRQALQQQIDELLGEETGYQIYYHA